MNEWSAVNKLSGHRNLLTKAEHILDLSNLSGTRSPGQDKSPWIVDLWDEQTFPGCFHCWENQQRLDIITFFKNRRNAEPRKQTMLRWKSHILKWIVGTAWISKIGPFQCRTQARGQANPVPWGGDGWSDITFFCQQPACLYS